MTIRKPMLRTECKHYWLLIRAARAPIDTNIVLISIMWEREIALWLGFLSIFVQLIEPDENGAVCIKAVYVST